ncbi:MAG: hypothetical protein AAGF35_08785 [Pseudomonadota bacterium]
MTATLGSRMGLTDQPDTRKQHSGSVPLTGGIALFFTVAISFAVFNIPHYGHLPVLSLIVLAIFLVGLWDDASHINPWLRLFIQYCCGLLIALFGGIAIHNVGNLLALGNIPLLLLTAPLTALAIAGLGNAYNMIDGIDGLAAAMMAMPLALLYVLALHNGFPVADSLLVLIVPLLVFLVFNLGPDNRVLPKIFLGDAGSLTGGLLVTLVLISASQGAQALILPVTALWLVTVPLMDMLATMLRRAKQGRKLMQADRSHLHYTLMDMGFSARQTLIILLVYAALCAMLGIALESIVPEFLSLLFYTMLFLGHCLFVVRSESIGRRLQPYFRAQRSADDVIKHH